MGSKQRNRKALVEDLVARRLVDEGKREKLEQYLKCRDEFLDMFGGRSEAMGSLGNFVGRVGELQELTKQVVEQHGQYQAFLRQDLMKRLELLLQDDACALKEIKDAVNSIKPLPQFAFNMDEEVRAAQSAALEGVDNVTWIDMFPLSSDLDGDWLEAGADVDGNRVNYRRRDGIHLTPAGGQFVGQRLLERLLDSGLTLCGAAN